jgi:hypothetical protein
MDTWYYQALPVARMVLGTFSTLNGFFKGFEGYESKTYLQSRNFVLVNCLPEIKGQLATDQLADLIEFEKSLETFDVVSWPRQDLDKFLPRMLSDSFDEGLSVFTEFMTAHRLSNAFGKANIKIYPQLSNGKVSDIGVSASNGSVFLEIGNLSYSEPQKIIQRVLKAGADHLRPSLIGNRYMQVEIETANFVFDEGPMYERRTIEKLNAEVDKLALSFFGSIDCNMDIKMAAEIVRDMAAYRVSKDFLPIYWGEAVNDLDTGLLSSWAKTADFTIVNEKMLVQSVISGQAKSPLLEFHTRGFYPSAGLKI